MEIIKWPNKSLRKKSVEVSLPLSDEVKKIAEELISYIDLSQDKNNDIRAGVGLSAIQMNKPLRMFYVNMKQNDEDGIRDVIINPTLIGESKMWAALKNGEGCLSVDEDYEEEGLVHRKNRVIVKGYSYFESKEKTWDVSGYTAIVFQHELDHLDGKLFIDRVNKEDRWKAIEGEHLI